MSLNFTVFDGGCALSALRKTELTAPLHMRPEHDAESLKAWLRDRRKELTKYERHKAEEALGKIEKLIGSIKERLEGDSRG
jgi:ribosome recycling factor